MDPDDVRPTHVGMQRVIVSAIRIFEDTTIERRLGVTVKTKVISLLETANQETANGEKASANQAVENFVRQAAARGSSNDVDHTKANILDESQKFVQHFTRNLIKNPSLTVPVNHLMR